MGFKACELLKFFETEKEGIAMDVKRAGGFRQVQIAFQEVTDGVYDVIFLFG